VTSVNRATDDGGTGRGKVPAAAFAAISLPGTASAAPGAARPATGQPAAAAAPPRSADALFARYSCAYAKSHPGQQVAILAAGCTTAGDPSAGARDSGSDVSITMVDEDQPATRAAAGRDELRGCVLGDLRTVPLVPRAFDIVCCTALLPRISNSELVLDRLVSALRPGGLLLLRLCDRDSAAGFLDRVLPGPVRRLVWRRRHPGEPGPHPAVYERLASARGVQAYALLRGLVVAERMTLGGLAGGLPPGPPGFLMAQRIAAWLSRGRLTAAHEELLYVLRKPENRFARVL
jgi:SAM-dependent methyltransferase